MALWQGFRQCPPPAWLILVLAGGKGAFVDDFIASHIHNAVWVVYLLIAFIMLFEGEMILFLAVYLAQKGELNLYILIPMAFVMAYGGDCLWYWFGARLAKIKWLGRGLSKLASPIDNFLRKHPRRTIFISKFTYGLNRATLVRVRASGVSFGRFLKIDLVTVIIWMSAICGLSFASFAAFESMKQNIKIAEFGILLAVLCFVVISRVVGAVSRRQIES